MKHLARQNILITGEKNTNLPGAFSCKYQSYQLNIYDDPGFSNLFRQDKKKIYSLLELGLNFLNRR